VIDPSSSIDLPNMDLVVGDLDVESLQLAIIEEQDDLPSENTPMLHRQNKKIEDTTLLPPANKTTS
jgi:hypothetical protein